MTSGTLPPVAEETPEQAEMRRRLRRNAATRKRTANHEAELIREARKLNVRWQDIADDLDRSREHVRLAAAPDKGAPRRPGHDDTA